MKKINLLILEDQPEQAQLLKDTLEVRNFNIIAIAESLTEAYELILSNTTIDFIVLDIFINGEPDGIKLAKQLYEKEALFIPYLFLTGSTERAIFEEAKLTNPYAYLLKPFNQLELIYTIELVFDKYNNEKNQFQSKAKKQFLPFFIKKQDRFVKIELDEIFYIEADGRYCKVVTSKHDFLIQNTLTAFINQLHPDLFLRTHRKYIVNKMYIQEVYYKDNLILMKNNKKALIGRAYKTSFFNAYNVLK